MKRTLDQIKAFELAKQEMPELKLKVVGDHSEKYGQKVIDYIQQSPYADDIEIFGRVDKLTKKYLMQKCHAILVTSVKEGWGLIVTEAASQATPAIVYNVDGLRDSVKDNWSGVVTDDNTPRAMAKGIKALLHDYDYKKLRHNAWQWSKQITFEKSYQQFQRLIRIST